MAVRPRKQAFEHGCFFPGRENACLDLFGVCIQQESQLAQTPNRRGSDSGEGQVVEGKRAGTTGPANVVMMARDADDVIRCCQSLPTLLPG